MHELLQLDQARWVSASQANRWQYGVGCSGGPHNSNIYQGSDGGVHLYCWLVAMGALPASSTSLSVNFSATEDASIPSSCLSFTSSLFPASHAGRSIVSFACALLRAVDLDRRPQRWRCTEHGSVWLDDCMMDDMRSYAVSRAHS